MEEKKNLEVVTGDGSSLDISPVYEHLNIVKPKPANEKPTNIVIPKETRKSSTDKKEEEEDSSENDKNDKKEKTQEEEN